MNPPSPSAPKGTGAFAERLRKTRERQGLNQRELAEKSDLTPAAISQLESGQREPNFSTVMRLASALGTSPNDLMGIRDGESLDPSLRGLFRQLKDLSKDDVDTVKAFVSFLAKKANG